MIQRLILFSSLLSLLGLTVFTFAEEKKMSSGRWSGVTGPLCGICANNGREARAVTVSRMGSWYWIGVSAGLGAAVGVLFAGAAGTGRVWRIAAVVVGAAVGAGVGFAIGSWQSGGWGDRAAGIVGALAGGLCATQTVSGALTRGGTRVGTAALVAGAAIVVAALAWIPAAGYVIALALLALVPLLRRARPERYAGLRTLARDE